RLGHGASTCPAHPGHTSSGPYPSRTAVPSRSYSRRPPPTSTTTARWPAAAISHCSPVGESISAMRPTLTHRKLPPIRGGPWSHLRIRSTGDAVPPQRRECHAEPDRDERGGDAAADPRN